MKKNLAPIAIFVYKRLDYLKILINSLKKNKLFRCSQIFFFSDSWKNEADKQDVLKVRKYISKIAESKKINIIFREKNYGLSGNIINGINQVLKNKNKIIVLEDDLKLSKNFLNFINDGLEIYKHEHKVASINGWFFPTPYNKNMPDHFFIRGADCWGWGTWKRAWNKFEPNASILLNRIKNKKLDKLFNFNNSFAYTRMLQNQVQKKNDSWAIRWYASVFLKNMFTLYPKVPLVQNIGTCNGENSKYDFLKLSSSILKKKYKPIVKSSLISENKYFRKQIEIFFNRGLLYKIKELIKLLFNA
jgi:hypothetical protein